MRHLYWGFSLVALCFLALLSGKSEHPRITQTLITRPAVPAPAPQHLTHATWYGPGFFGNHTACGKVYVKHAVFVAHRTYPFGTKLSITNLRNHRNIVAVVEDRGPYFHPGRDLDLSYAAAQKLDMVETGVVLVSYSKLPSSPQGGSGQ